MFIDRARIFVQSGKGGDAAALTPNYIRLSQAERARLEANTTE